MFRPKVLASVLNEANESSTVPDLRSYGGENFTLLLNREGALLAASAAHNASSSPPGSNQQPRVVSAIVSTVWALASQNVAALEADPLNVLIVDCEKARIAVTSVGNGGLLLCMYCTTKGISPLNSSVAALPPMGMLKVKLDALKRHLDEPLSQIATTVA